MDESRPHPIAALASTEAGAAIRVRGRVLEVSGDAWVLADPSGSVAVRADRTVPEGALVEGLVHRTPDGTLSIASVTVHARPLGDRGLHRGGDVRRLLGDPGRARRVVQGARARKAIRAFLDARDYLEVETPTLVPNPGMDVHLDAFRVEGTVGERYLATSPEYAMKRLVAAGFERIYQLGRSHRRDEAGVHHEPEFTLLEWYRAHASMDEMMRETEALCAAVVAACNEGRTAVERDGRRLDFAPPWPVWTVDEALRRFASTSLSALRHDDEALFRVLALDVQPALGRGTPVWLVDWPIEHASLARAKPGDPSVAERFEAYAEGIELCNGFGELVDPVEQRRRFEADRAARIALGKPVYPLDERFLAALEDGMPASAGNALGVDRLLLLATGADAIDDVLAIGSRHVE